MRNIADVISKMRAHIPLSEEAFIYDLDDILDSVRYSPPESIGMWWNELHCVVNMHLPGPDECAPWQTQVGLIYMDRA